MPFANWLPKKWQIMLKWQRISLLFDPKALQFLFADFCQHNTVALTGTTLIHKNMVSLQIMTIII